MNSTPLWLPLAIAGIGLLGTIMGTVTGVLIAQRRSDRREREIWQRERDREQQLWAREDALRNFEQRRDTYVSFYETLRKTVLKVYDTFYERKEDYNSNELVLYDSIRRDLGMAGVLQDGRPIPGSGWAVDGGE